MYIPSAAAIAVLSCCLLAGFRTNDSKGGQEPRISVGAARSGVGPTCEHYGAEALRSHGDGGDDEPVKTVRVLADALKAHGNGDDEAVRRALAFVSRCQNLQTEHNAPR